METIEDRRRRVTLESAIRFARAGTQAKSLATREAAAVRLAELEAQRLHGSHCFADSVPVCGWPEMHR